MASRLGREVQGNCQTAVKAREWPCNFHNGAFQCPRRTETEANMNLRRLSAIFVAFIVMSTATLAETVNITFLLTNDIDKFAGEEKRGGVDRLNAVVKAERARGHVVYVHAGDTISPSLLSGLDKGEHMIALFNMAPPDAFTPGNHEYD